MFKIYKDTNAPLWCRKGWFMTKVEHTVCDKGNSTFYYSVMGYKQFTTESNTEEYLTEKVSLDLLGAIL